MARLGSIVSALLAKQENGKSTEEQPRDTGEQPGSMSSLEEKPEEDSKGDITSSLADKPECGEDSGEQQPVYVHVMLGGGWLLLRNCIV